MVNRKADFLCERPTGGTQDDDTGTWTEAGKETVYNASVTWQDGINPRNAERLEAQLGVKTSDIDYTLFLTLESKISEFSLQDKGQIEFANGEQEHVEIIGIRKLDSSIYVKRHG